MTDTSLPTSGRRHADLAGLLAGLHARAQAERSVDRWAATNRVRLSHEQRQRMVKFLTDWTRP